MTINVFKQRTLIVPGFPGITLDPGENTVEPEIEKACVAAGFAEQLDPEVTKAHETAENKMIEAAENKATLGGRITKILKRAKTKGSK